MEQLGQTEEASFRTTTDRTTAVARLGAAITAFLSFLAAVEGVDEAGWVIARELMLVVVTQFKWRGKFEQGDLILTVTREGMWFGWYLNSFWRVLDKARERL